MIVRVFSIVNQKGGCGKTTTAINLAAVAAKRGIRTLLIDMDPQSHCAAGLGVPEERIDVSVGDALVADHASLDVTSLLWQVNRNLDLAPSTMMLTALEAPGGGLHSMPDRDRRLENLLGLMHGRFDYCFIDCPPNIGLLTFNALRAATEAIVPVETGYFSLRGARRQRKTIAASIARVGRHIPCHILPSLHRPSPLARTLLQRLHESFGDEVAPVIIREHETLREAVSFGQPVIEFAPGSEAERDFEHLADWLEDIGRPPQPIVHVEARGTEGRAAEIARRMEQFSVRSTERPDRSVLARIAPEQERNDRHP
ncbi:MAG: ParA family protein [Phycisphaerales bacterium]|nr:ParA family protein [Phycisphaerales bacterium]